MTETQTKPRLQGIFEWSDGKSIHIEARFDKVALDQNRLFFISLVAFGQDVKALRAAFAVGVDSPIHLKNVTLSRDGESTIPGDVRPAFGGYRLDTHRLGFGSIHALFTCRQPGFLPNESDDALWQELKQERFTTPLLRGWLPYIRKELEIKSLLSRCHTLDCTCCVLDAKSADLDSIVEFGLKNGLIRIEQGAQS
jgi:hypothetical protein